MFDPTTLSAYAAGTTPAERAQAVRDSLGSGTLTVELRDGETLVYAGTFAGPMTAGGDGSLSADVLLSGAVTTGGTPDAATWTCRIRNADGRYVEGSFGPGGRFTWSGGALVVGQAVRLRVSIAAGGAFVLGNPELVAFEEWPPPVSCVIPDVEGFNYHIHPKTLDTGTPGWNGKRYWMTTTNYPGTNDAVENPAVWRSDDGTSWAAPGSNPVVPRPEDGQLGVVYNNDSHITLVDGAMYLFWRIYDNRAGSTYREWLYYKTSVDGINWSAAQFALGVKEDWNSGLLSPCVEYKDGEWWLFSARNRTAPNRLVLRKSASPSGPWSAPVLTDFAMPASAGSRQLWHQDIIWTPRGWAMLACDQPDYRLWFAYGSPDGLNWSVRSEPLNTVGPQQYRPSLVRNGAGFDCWLSRWGTLRYIQRARLLDGNLV